MNVVIGAKTDPGRRTNNEDRLAVVDMRRYRLHADSVLVVADGMGGRSLGERASNTAVEIIQESLVELLALSRPVPADIGEALVSALRKANARVYEMSRDDGEGRGMGTTCVAAVVSGPTLTVAHAGDSRAYLLHDGQLERLTDDHSYVAEQVRAGVITEEGARSSRFRNVITRAVGIEPTITPEVSQYEVQSGDTLLLCTDGLTNVVSEDEIAQILLSASSPQTAAERLIRVAVQSGGKDNVTAIVARVDAGNRTEQMRPEDLPRYAVPGERTQQMRFRNLTTTHESAISAKTSVRAETLEAFGGIGHKVRTWPPLWQSLSGLAIIVLVSLCTLMTYVLVRDGYMLDASAPFLSRPAVLTSPTSNTSPGTLARLLYAPPVLFFVRPVQGGLLSLNDADGSITVAAQDGQVVRLAHDGTVSAKFPMPTGKAAASAPILAADGNQHAAADPQGNLYVADAGARLITKYAPNGMPLGHISLTRPAALAVAPDGTIYVIDDGRLKVIRPLPPGSLLPSPPLKFDSDPQSFPLLPAFHDSAAAGQH